MYRVAYWHKDCLCMFVGTESDCCRFCRKLALGLVDWQCERVATRRLPLSGTVAGWTPGT